METRQWLLALALAIPLIAGADSCPVKMQEIDVLLGKTAELDAAVKEEVVALRTEGEALHKEGDHEQSMELLEQALQLLKDNQ